MAAGLRDAGFYGKVTLIGSEPDPPYERPHLSKGFLAGAVPREKLWLRPKTQYRDLEIDLVLGRRALELGLDERRVLLDGGKTIGWDVLCIATGSGARKLPQIEPARYLRELPSAEALREVIDERESLDIVGAGFIGCEVAAVAVEKGCKVRVHEALEQPLMRVLGSELGGFLADLHRQHGVDLRLNVSDLPELNRPLVAIGSTPRTELAEQSRLEVDRGIVVDALGSTSVDGVFAAGDATRFFSPLYEQHIRVEHFQTSQRQGFAVGRAMAGATQPYSEVPWFWSDQYDMNLQYVGAGLPWDELITRGEFGHPPFTVFYLSHGQLVGAAGINDHHTIARIRHVMEKRKPVSAQQLADPNLDLRKLLA